MRASTFRKAGWNQTLNSSDQTRTTCEFFRFLRASGVISCCEVANLDFYVSVAFGEKCEFWKGVSRALDAALLVFRTAPFLVCVHVTQSADPQQLWSDCSNAHKVVGERVH
jgi:hypothetical protein